MTDYAKLAREYGGRLEAPTDLAALAQQYGGAVAAPAAPAAPTGVQSATANPLGRMAQGMRDPVDAAAQIFERAVPERIRAIVNDFGNFLADLGLPVSYAPQSGYASDAAVADSERRYQEARQATGSAGIDFARAGGNLITMAPAAAAAPVRATLGAKTAIGAMTGGASGMLQPVTGNTEDFWTEKVKQAGGGALFGAAAAPIAHGIARVIQPQTAPHVREMIDAGVTPTPGQILGGFAQRTEDKLTSLPILGDAISAARRNAINQFNTAVYNRALTPLGQKAGDEVGFKGVEAVRRALSDTYEELLPKLRFQADDAFKAELETVRAMAATLPEQQAKRFEQILKQQVLDKMTPQGLASGRTMQTINSELGKFADGYRGNRHFDDQQLAAALDEVQAAIRRQVTRINPEHATELKALQTGWANYARIRDAAAQKGAHEGVFTPSQLWGAAKRGDKSVGKRATSEGQALMQDLAESGRTALGSKYPDSGSAGRLWMGGATAGGGYFLEPSIPLTLGAASLPYLPYLRGVTAAMLTQRPEFAGPLAEGVRAFLPPAGAVMAPALLNR